MIPYSQTLPAWRHAVSHIFAEGFQGWGAKTAKWEPGTAQGCHAVVDSCDDSANAQKQGGTLSKMCLCLCGYSYHAGYPWGPSEQMKYPFLLETPSCL